MRVCEDDGTGKTRGAGGTRASACANRRWARVGSTTTYGVEFGLAEFVQDCCAVGSSKAALLSPPPPSVPPESCRPPPAASPTFGSPSLGTPASASKSPPPVEEGPGSVADLPPRGVTLRAGRSRTTVQALSADTAETRGEQRVRIHLSFCFWTECVRGHTACSWVQRRRRTDEADRTEEPRLSGGEKDEGSRSELPNEGPRPAGRVGVRGARTYSGPCCRCTLRCGDRSLGRPAERSTGNQLGAGVSAASGGAAC